jgi:protein-S-isoprenylcysteine O-methyltransferase Ste14
MRMDILATSLLIALLACFAVFLAFVFRSPGEVRGKKEKSPVPVRVGAILQSLSYMFAWTFRRPRIDPFRGEARWPDVLIAVLSLAAALGAIALVRASKKHLGRQWALAARVIDGHALVTTGPFGRVRHPLYLAMGLLLFAPLIGFGTGLGTALSVPLFAAGTLIRVRAEESVLAEAFGAEYRAYRERVPAFIPRPCKTAGTDR